MPRRGLIVILCALLLLTGCGTGRPRELSHLRIAEVLGLDISGENTVLAVAGSSMGEGAERLHISGSAATAVGAMERVREKASGELFYGSTEYLLLGEDAAYNLTPALELAARSPELRLSLPLFILRGGEAGALVMDCEEVSKLLAVQEQSIRERGAGHIPDCAEICRRLLRNGAALAAAISREDNSDAPALLPAGYAIIKGTALAGYLTGETALGVGLLSGKPGCARIELPSGAALEISGGAVKLKPRWDASGEPQGLSAEVSVTASVVTLPDGVPMSCPELERELENRAALWVQTVLSAAQRLNADFIGIGERFRLDKPRLWAKLETHWGEILPRLELDVRASAKIERSYGSDSAGGAISHA